MPWTDENVRMLGGVFATTYGDDTPGIVTVGPYLPNAHTLHAAFPDAILYAPSVHAVHPFMPAILEPPYAGAHSVQSPCAVDPVALPPAVV